MARRKKPQNETVDQTKVRQTLEKISNAATRSEKVSWDRKMDNMVRLIAQLTPIEQQIVDLMAQKTPILDEINELRADMVTDCVHPYTHLVHKNDEEEGDVILCKFCNKRFKVLNNE
jgi:hypothetical protein